MSAPIRVVVVEDSIVQVVPPQATRVFHPKIWVLRFTNATGEFTHRLVCLSRNLTGDRSWDTVLSTDEDPSAPHQMAALIQFMAAFQSDLSFRLKNENPALELVNEL